MRKRTDPDHALAVVLMVLAVVGVAATFFIGCTPEQSDEWIGWYRHDKDGAGAWLASPEGQASLTDPAIDVPAPPPPPQPALRNRQGDRVWNYIARCESGRHVVVPADHQPARATYWRPDDLGTVVGATRREGVRRVALPRVPCQQIHIAEKIVDAQGLDRGSAMLATRSRS